MLSVKQKIFDCHGEATFLVTLLLVLFITTVGLGGYFYYAKEKITQQYLEKVDTLNKRIVSLSEHCRKRDIENNELADALDLSEKNMEAYQKRYALNNELQAELDTIKSMLNKQFVSMNELLIQGFETVDVFQTGFDSRLEEHLTTNRKEMSHLVQEGQRNLEKIAQKADVELKKLIVSPDYAHEKLQAQEGQSVAKINPYKSTQDVILSHQRHWKKPEKKLMVMNINHEHQFFVINHGMIDGVKVGNTVRVIRDSQPIAAAIITEVRELVSLAKIREIFTDNFVEEGDLIQFN